MNLNESQRSQPDSTDALRVQARPLVERAISRDRVIWLLVAFALILRIAYNLALSPNHIDWYNLIIDEREYYGAAHMLAEGRGFTFFDTALWVRPPLYVALLGLLLRLGEGAYLPVLVVQSILSAASLLPLGLLAYRLGGKTAARWCIGLGAIYLPFTLFSGLLLSETLFVFLLCCALVALEKGVSAASASWSRSGLLWIGLAGVLLGLATLTRATALALIPLSAISVFVSLRRRDHLNGARVLALAGALLVMPMLVIAPWSARNWAAYGLFIPVDTTSGYNLWLGSVGVRDEERLQADLRAIENPADRQAFALERGLENITTDPMTFAGKGVKESLDLWRPLFSAEERQVRGFASGRVPAWHLASLLLFDDLTYALILLAAAVGFAYSTTTPLRLLTLLWLVSWVVIAFVFFAVTRFRLPVVALLLPWVGMGMTHLTAHVRALRSFHTFKVGQKLGLLAAVLFIAVVVLPAVPVGDTILGIGRWQAQEPFRRGEVHLRAGRVEEAIAAYQAASGDVTDTRYSLAAAYLQAGDTQNALGQLVPEEPPRRFEPLLIRGEAARLSGDLDAARSFFNERTVNLAGDEALRWAWDHFAPPLTTTIDLGSGLDVGYVRGFYSSESEGDRRFRWSSARMEVRRLDVSSASGVRVEMSGWRPDQLRGAQVEIVAPGTIEQELAEAFVVTLPKDAIWTITEVKVGTRGPDTGPNAGISAMVDPFIGSGADPRLLGIRVTRISVEP